VVVVLIGGCREETPRVEPEPSPGTAEATATADPGDRYRSIDDLTRDMSNTNVACTDLNYLDAPDPGLKEFALCDPERDPLQRLNIYLFKSASGRDSYFGSIVQSGLPWMFGPNWIVVAAGEPETAQDRLKHAQEAIGGQIPEVEFNTSSP